MLRVTLALLAVRGVAGLLNRGRGGNALDGPGAVVVELDGEPQRSHAVRRSALAARDSASGVGRGDGPVGGEEPDAATGRPPGLRPAETRYYSFMCAPRSVVGIFLYPSAASSGDSGGGGRGGGDDVPVARLEFPVSAMLPTGGAENGPVDVWHKDWYALTVSAPPHPSADSSCGGGGGDLESSVETHARTGKDSDVGPAVSATEKPKIAQAASVCLAAVQLIVFLESVDGRAAGGADVGDLATLQPAAPAAPASMHRWQTGESSGKPVVAGADSSQPSVWAHARTAGHGPPRNSGRGQRPGGLQSLTPLEPPSGRIVRRWPPSAISETPSDLLPVVSRESQVHDVDHNDDGGTGGEASEGNISVGTSWYNRRSETKLESRDEEAQSSQRFGRTSPGAVGSQNPKQRGSPMAVPPLPLHRVRGSS